MTEEIKFSQETARNMYQALKLSQKFIRTYCTHYLVMATGEPLTFIDLVLYQAEKEISDET
jgi:hypothetical protein